MSGSEKLGQVAVCAGAVQQEPQASGKSAHAMNRMTEGAEERLPSRCPWGSPLVCQLSPCLRTRRAAAWLGRAGRPGGSVPGAADRGEVGARRCPQRWQGLKRRGQRRSCEAARGPAGDRNCRRRPGCWARRPAGRPRARGARRSRRQSCAAALPRRQRQRQPPPAAPAVPAADAPIEAARMRHGAHQRGPWVLAWALAWEGPLAVSTCCSVQSPGRDRPAAAEAATAAGRPLHGTWPGRRAALPARQPSSPAAAAA